MLTMASKKRLFFLFFFYFKISPIDRNISNIAKHYRHYIKMSRETVATFILSVKTPCIKYVQYRLTDAEQRVSLSLYFGFAAASTAHPQPELHQVESNFALVFA